MHHKNNNNRRLKNKRVMIGLPNEDGQETIRSPKNKKGAVEY